MMNFRKMQAILAAALAAGMAHGQAVDDRLAAVYPEEISRIDDRTESSIRVRYKQVVSPETFTFNENVAWAVRSLLRPEATLGNAVIMYGYAMDLACKVVEQQNPDAPAALAIPPRSNAGHASQAELARLYSVSLYETAGDACAARRFAQALADANASNLDAEQANIDDELTISMLADILSTQVTPAS